jgi:threonine dehydratase
MITLTDIQQAHARIKHAIVRTPLLPAPQAGLYLKPENFQPMGAFKLRGAYNAIAALNTEERARGVVAHSSGNHAQAVAYAATALGARSVIIIPKNAPQLKIDKTKAYGGEVVLVGNSSDERMSKFNELIAQHNYVAVPPFDDERVMAGQGTISLEVFEDLPDVGAILVPVSGGGLIAGVAVALKTLKPDVKIIGVEPELAADAHDSFKSGQLVGYAPEQTAKTVADGLRVQQLGSLTWPVIQKYVDDIITVSEVEIYSAMRTLALDARVVAEPSGAVTYAAWQSHCAQLPNVKNTVAIISGGNVEPELLAKVVRSAENS